MRPFGDTAHHFHPKPLNPLSQIPHHRPRIMSGSRCTRPQPVTRHAQDRALGCLDHSAGKAWSDRTAQGPRQAQHHSVEWAAKPTVRKWMPLSPARRNPIVIVRRRRTGSPKSVGHRRIVTLLECPANATRLAVHANARRARCERAAKLPRPEPCHSR